MSDNSMRRHLLGDWIAISAQDVELENGEIVRTEACDMMKTAVTVRMFREFARQSGHVTKAEQSEDTNEVLTYCKNGYNADDDGRVRDDASACCISRNDAEAFCRWFGVKLPSEAQWLAGALVTNRLIPFDGLAGELAAGTVEHRLENDGIELTDTRGPNGLGVVARSGPMVAKYPGWQEDVADHRFLLQDNDSFEEAIGFRCIRDSGS